MNIHQQYLPKRYPSIKLFKQVQDVSPPCEVIGRKEKEKKGQLFSPKRGQQKQSQELRCCRTALEMPGYEFIELSSHIVPR